MEPVKRMSGRMSILHFLAIASIALPLSTACLGDNNNAGSGTDQRAVALQATQGNQKEPDTNSSVTTPVADKAEAGDKKSEAKMLVPPAVHPDLALDEAVMNEIGLRKDSPLIAEIRHLSQSLVKEIQKGFGELADQGQIRNQEALFEVQAKVRAKHAVVLKQLLTPEQFERLKQIHWQRLGANVVNDPEVAAALRLTDEQKEKLGTAYLALITPRQKLVGQQRRLGMTRRDPAVEGAEDDQQKPDEIQKAIDELDAQMQKQYAEIMTAEQQTKLDQLKGKPFEAASTVPRPVARRRSQMMPISVRSGGLMSFALQEPVLLDLGIEKTDQRVAAIRKLSEAMGVELMQQVRSSRLDDQEQVRVLASTIEEKYIPELIQLLTSEQLTRLRQIYWQSQHVLAFDDARVSVALQLTEAQKEELLTVKNAFFEEARNLFKPFRDRKGNTNTEELKAQRLELIAAQEKKIDQILTESQRRKWVELKGKPFNLDLLQSNSSEKRIE